MVECKSWKRCHRPSDQTLQKRLNSFLQQKHYSIRRDSPTFLETDPEVIYSLPPDPVAYSFFRKLCSFFLHQEKICSLAISPDGHINPSLWKTSGVETGIMIHHPSVANLTLPHHSLLQLNITNSLNRYPLNSFILLECKNNQWLY